MELEDTHQDSSNGSSYENSSLSLPLPWAPRRTLSQARITAISPCMPGGKHAASLPNSALGECGLAPAPSLCSPRKQKMPTQHTHANFHSLPFLPQLSEKIVKPRRKNVPYWPSSEANTRLLFSFVKKWATRLLQRKLKFILSCVNYSETCTFTLLLKQKTAHGARTMGSH